MSGIRKNKAKIIFSLLALFFVFTLGYWIWLEKQRCDIRHEVKALLKENADKSDLTLLTFSPEQLYSDLHWEHSKEFEYKGEMYDIVEAKWINEKIHYWCWKDSKETKLNQQLNRLLTYILGNGDDHQKTKLMMNRLAQSLHFEEMKKITIPEHTQIAPHHFCYSEHGSIWTIAPPVPPPDFV